MSCRPLAAATFLAHLRQRVRKRALLALVCTACASRLVESLFYAMIGAKQGETGFVDEVR